MASSLIITDDYSKIQSADKRTYRSLPILTKYEFDQIIGLRTMHLSRGAPPLVALSDGVVVESNINLREVAQKELLEGAMGMRAAATDPKIRAELERFCTDRFEQMKKSSDIKDCMSKP